MNDDKKEVESKEIDKPVEARRFRLSDEEQARFASEFETVKRGEGTPPIYGYLGVAAIIGLFFAKVFEDGTRCNITYILAALAVVNALIISSFVFTSLQIHELKQFQTFHSDPDGAETAWEFRWRRDPKNSLTCDLRKVYYGGLYLFLWTVSLFLIVASFVTIHKYKWWESWAATLAILAHILPFRLTRREFGFAQDRWTEIQKIMDARQTQRIVSDSREVTTKPDE